MLVLFAFACGDETSESEPSGDPIGGDAGGSNPTTTEGGDAGTDPGPTLPTLSYQQLSLPDVNDAVPCSGAAGAGTIARVAFAQTHLMTPDWPFFYLAAERPALLFANITGTGTAPEVSVEAKVQGASIGKLCLKGPAQLPGTLDPASPDKQKSFTLTLPAAWIKPGLELTLRAGSTTRVLTAAELKIGPSPIGTLTLIDFLFFGDKTGHDPAKLPMEFLAKTPLSKLNYGRFPVPIELSKFVVAPDAIYGRDTSGNPMTSPVALATRGPSCTDAEKAAKTCTTYGAFAFIGAARHLAGEIARANGLSMVSATYGDLSPSAGSEGTGLGGGFLGAGGGYGLVFNHEMGHGFNFPHWGDVTPPRATSASDTYPYAGDFPEGGGFGRTWAYDALDGELMSPICPLDNKERQDPLQRNGLCAQDANIKAGRLHDPFSDFSAHSIFRLFVGGPARTGTVSYKGGNVPFGQPERVGMVEMRTVSPPTFASWNTQANGYSPTTMSPEYPDYPTAANVPVYLITGAFHFPSDTLSILYKPVLYRGNLVRSYDPTLQADFDALKKNYAAHYGWDLTVRAEYTDGTIRHVLVQKDIRGANRMDPKSEDSIRFIAVNVPADKTLKKATLLYRPFATRIDPADPFEGNVNATGSPITPANVFENARVAASVDAAP